jgi:hypothetical protein
MSCTFGVCAWWERNMNVLIEAERVDFPKDAILQAQLESVLKSETDPVRL